MQRIFLRFCLLLLPFLMVASANAKTPHEEVKAAVEKMRTWLGDNENAKAWHKHLRSDDLQAQLKKGAKADPLVVTEILKKYSGSSSGLKKDSFIAVRDALGIWLDELSIVSIDQLPKMARDSKGHYTAVTDKQIAANKTKLNEAIKVLDSLLKNSGKEREDGWKKKLLWEDMQAQLKAKDGPNLRILQTVSAKYYRNKNGLEMKQFMGVRDRLRDYTNAVYFAKLANADKVYQAKLDQLAKLLETHASKPTTTSALAIGRILGWLENAGQADSLVKATRHHYYRPNLIGHASARMLTAGIDDKVNDKTKVNEVILGTDVNGTAVTRGDVSGALVPNSTRGIIEIRLNANATSENVGYNRSVTIYTSGKTKIDATKRLVFDSNGIRALPAEAKCSTQTTVNDIAAGGFAQGVAWQRVNESKGEAQRIASRRAEIRVQKRMDDKAKGLLEKSNGSFQEKFRKPLLRRNAYPPSIKFSTTSEQLNLAIVQASAFQLGAATKPPELVGKHDLAIRMHESMVGNFSESLIGGVTLTDEKLAEMVKNMTGKVPEELEITEDKDPWSITFAPSQPITMTFDKGIVKIAIHAQRFTRGENGINDPMIISATYKMTKTNAGMKLARQGDVQANYTSDGRQSASQTAFKAIILKKFTALFKEEIAGDGLQLKGRWEKLGKLRLRQLDCTNGWLALGWEAPTKNVRTANKEKDEK